MNSSATAQKTGRNAPCPCGSGKKFKHCCASPARTATNAPSFARLQLSRQAEALAKQGADFLRREQPAASVEFFRRAIACAPDFSEAHFNLAVAYYALDALEPAAACLHRVLQLNPNAVAALERLGLILFRLDRIEDAFDCFKRATALDDGLDEAHYYMGVILQNAGQPDAAVDCYRRALTINAGLAEAHNNLGVCLRLLGQIDEAIACCTEALALAPNFALAHNNLGLFYKDVGRLDEAVDSYRRAIACDPAYTQAHSNLLYLLYFHPDHNDASILLEAKKLAAGEALARGASEPITPIAHIAPVLRGNAPRRLRIGYVSPDFREHCQSLFTLPLFENHDRTNFEICCYAHLPQPDALSERLAAHADLWRATHQLNDAQLAALIAADHLDVLVDLTMHMAGGRPAMFARKPAPVQVAWLAYPGTTGLPAIDYRLTDPWLDPAGQSEDCYSERSERLPDTFWCYDPLTSDLEPGPLPALMNGYVTFGCLNNFCKVSEQTLRLWARVMAALPTSKLLLLAPEGRHRGRVLNILEKCGIAGVRVEFMHYLPRREYLQTFQRIDLCLDTLPYNGHTTSLDAYWMGVPVITRVGNTIAGRAGWSQLNNLGHAELAAFDDDAFVRIALDLAGDPEKLDGLRTTLRAALQSSPLMDGPRFARAIEAIYTRIALPHSSALIP